MSTGPRDLSHWTPSTTSAPQSGNTWKSTVKVWFYTWIVTPSQSWWYSISLPLPTITRRGNVGLLWIPRERTKWSCTKLWVLPPSIKITTFWSEIRPNKCKVLGARWPDKACRLIWAYEGSVETNTSEKESMTRSPSWWPSLSTMRRKNFEEHLCLWLNFSSQLKHSPFSLWLAISSGDKHLRGTGGDFGGEGNRGGTGAELGETE